MRCVLGAGPSEMDLIQALHLAKNDINLAFNVLFDTIGYKGVGTNVKRTTAGSGARVFTTCLQEQVPSVMEQTLSPLIFDDNIPPNDSLQYNFQCHVLFLTNSLNRN